MFLTCVTFGLVMGASAALAAGAPASACRLERPYALKLAVRGRMCAWPLA
jgi:hypothetical protein